MCLLHYIVSHFMRYGMLCLMISSGNLELTPESTSYCLYHKKGCCEFSLKEIDQWAMSFEHNDIMDTQTETSIVSIDKLIWEHHSALLHHLLWSMARFQVSFQTFPRSCTSVAHVTCRVWLIYPLFMSKEL